MQRLASHCLHPIAVALIPLCLLCASGAKGAPASIPFLADVTDSVTHVRVVGPSGVPVDTLNLTTDDDTTRLYLMGYNMLDMQVRLVSGDWTATGGIGSPSPASGSGTVLLLTGVGTGYAVGESGGVWIDSTGVITVAHGAYARLSITTDPTATAGTAFAASVAGTDSDGNQVSSGPGASADVVFLAYADSVGATPADPLLSPSGATLASGGWSGSLTALRSGTYWLAARDTVAAIESTDRARVDVAPAPADHIVLVPDSVQLVSGIPDTLTVLVFDSLGNRAPAPTSEVLTLWTDRPAGRLQSLSGSPIFEVTLPAGADSVEFRMIDTQAGGGPSSVRAIDANGTGASLGTASSPVTTVPNVPLGNVTLFTAPGTIVANGVDSSFVTSGAVSDGYGNVVAAGERFTVTGTLVVPLDDVDPVEAGVQWETASGGTLSGWVRAGVTKGVGSVAVVSVAPGTANGVTPLVLIAGVPAGAVPLTADPDSVAADSVATRTIAAAGLVDANGNQVEDGEAYTVSTTKSAIASPDQDGGTPGIQVLASGGAITFDLFGGDSLGTATVGATSVRGSATGSVDVRLVPGEVSATRSSVAATSPAPVGPGGSTVTITVRDGQDHAIAQVAADSVLILVMGVPAVVTPLSAETDSAGAIDFRATTTLADTATVSATVRGVAVAQEPAIVFEPGPLDHYVLSGPPGPLTAGVAQSFSVAARDTFENPMPGLSGVVLRDSVATGGAILPDSVLLAAGSASVPFTPTLAQPLTIRVRDDSGRSVTYGPVAVTAAAAYRLIALAAPGDTLAAGDSMAVAARLFDAFGNPVSGGQADASVVAGGGNVSPASATTDTTATAGFTLRAGQTPGPLTLRFLAPASAAEDSIRADSIFVTVVPASTDTLEVLPDSLDWVAGESVRVRVRPLDRFGNLVTADAATITMGPSGAVTWSPVSGPPVAGEFVTFGRDTVAESIAIAASRVGGGSGSAGPVVVRPAAGAAISVVAGDGQSAVVDRELPTPLRVRVEDAFGNPVPGDSVLFHVLTGNGSLDVVRGVPPDSVAVTNTTGIALCEVVRLGTVVAPGSDQFRAKLLAAPLVHVDFTESALPDTATSLAIAPPSIALPAAGTDTVSVLARDAFGNLAPATSVTFFLGAPALGTLESLGSTSGGSGSQTGFTDAAGAIAVRYRAPASAPAADSIYARGVTIAPVGILATVGAAATASLRVLPATLDWVAGASVQVRVQAIDAFGNRVFADTATVVMTAPGSAVTWSASFGPMVAGELVMFASDTLAEAVSSLTADRVGGGTGGAGPVTVRPAAPAGPIAIFASRDTLTADGRSSTDVTLGPVRDAFGNTVPPGTLVRMDPTAATLIAPDASPLPGLDLATGSAGTASLALIAPSSPGADTLRASSRVGTATGSHVFAYEPPPSIAYTAGSIAPVVVVPGSPYAFRLRVANTGTGTIQIGAGTTVSFGGGAEAYTAALAAPVALGSGQSDTLRFASVAVSDTLTPGTYAPALRAIGTDGTGEPFDFYLSLAGAQVHVAGVLVAAVSAAPSPVPLGYADLTLVFDVSNSTGVAAAIDAASLAYSIGAFTTNGVTPALPTALPAGGTTRLSLSVRVPSGGIPDGTVVDARLTATATFAGSSVTGINAAPLSFRVESAAQIAAVPGGAAPPRYLRARTFGPSVRVANNGTSTVILAAGATRLVLEHPGGDLLVTGLRAATAVAGGDTATLAFDSLAVAGTVARGSYGARLLLSGTESGQAFADTIPLDPDSVAVLEPPLLAVQGALDPDTVSAGQTRPLRLTLQNSGDVAFNVDPGTLLRLGSPLFVDLTLGAPATLNPGSPVDIVFAGAPLGSAPSPGIAAAALEARGTEDGRFREETLPAGSLAAEPPAALAFIAGSALPDTVRAGQTYDLTVEVRNAGGSPFVLDPAASRLVVTDGVEQVVALGSGAALTLAPAAQATLSFPNAAFPATLASQPYPVSLTLYGTEWSLPESVAVVSPQGEILVREPVSAVQVRALDVQAPVQVAPGAADVRAWGLEVTPLVPPGGVTSARLTTLRLTVLTDGGPGASPSANVASLALRSAAGTLLAQAPGGSGNPISLSLGTPVLLTSQAESIYVEVTFAGGASARDVALRLAADTDLVTLDDLTGAPVAVRGGGGLPFTQLTSPALTLFARAHGYPNPFHAGREDVRLSYLLAEDAAVRVSIYTLLGDLVRELSLAAGSTGGSRGLNEVAWDGRNGSGDLVRPGVYVARIEGAGTSEQVKVGVLR